ARLQLEGGYAVQPLRNDVGQYSVAETWVTGRRLRSAMNFVPAKDQITLFLFNVLDGPNDVHLPVAAQCAVLDGIGCQFVNRNPDLNGPIRCQKDIRALYTHAIDHIERKSVSTDQIV